ncbi:hypothetical protein BJ878DRAFT_527622 [Calycina marina]|uniref:Stress-response A/B barrel domain-containing protein n=1 Tax=Calycina marina TaxID=1763456 RepID=A0A9P7YUS5_9HELO|nr:hypothetical protein BJ878DRAFT_527622 [Calycina marina]
MSKLIRVTMFKLPSPESQQKLIGCYKALSQTASKDGKPYILSLEAGPANPDQRSQGYTFVSISEFASMEDMAFYDEGCEAHARLRAEVKELGVEGVLTVHYEPVVMASL